MYAFVRIALVAALAMSGGFTWTVGQSGLKQTNTNLCELWASLPLPSYSGCEFQYGLVLAWAAVFALTILWVLIIIYRAARKFLTIYRLRLPWSLATKLLRPARPSKWGEKIALSSTPSSQSFLRLSVAEDKTYVIYEGHIYSIKKTYQVKLENTDPSKAATRCKISILSVEPDTHYTPPWLLKENFYLSAGDSVYVPLVRYGEAREPDKFDCKDTMMTMATDDERPILEAQSVYTITLRATAIDAPYCDLRCKVWVDDKGKMRIEKL